jgi:hypothetical protein
LVAEKSKPVKNRRRSTGSTASRWLAARKISQGLALLLFLALFVMAQRGGWPTNLANASMRLDPLLVLAHLLASRTFLAGSGLALIVLILGLVAGRAWCGWLCPLGTILDLFPMKRQSARRINREERPAFPPESWRGLKYGLLVMILVAALLGNLTLLALDPITILFRSLTAGLWPVLDRLVTALETGLYNLPFLSDPVATFDGVIRPAILPAEPIFSRQVGLYVLIFLGVIGLNLLAPRFWCRYLCPLGGLLGMLAKLALFRRVVAPDCTGCGWSAWKAARAAEFPSLPASLRLFGTNMTLVAARHYGQSVPRLVAWLCWLAMPDPIRSMPIICCRPVGVKMICCRCACGVAPACAPVRPEVCSPLYSKREWRVYGRRFCCLAWGIVIIPVMLADRFVRFRLFLRSPWMKNDCR